MPSRGTLPCSRGFAAISLCNSRTSQITELIFQAPRTSICPARTAGAMPRIRKTLRLGVPRQTRQYFMGFSSNYQSLQASLNKRFSNGLAFTTAFTWGKGWVTSQIPDQPAVPTMGAFSSGSTTQKLAPLDFDRTVNFEQTFTYELPFGRGHSMFNSGVGACRTGRVAGIGDHLSRHRASIYGPDKRGEPQYSRNSSDWTADGCSTA